MPIDMDAPFEEFASLYLQQPKEHELFCRKCKTTSPLKDWDDVGECSEGCCDKMRCPACGRDILFECGD